MKVKSKLCIAAVMVAGLFVSQVEAAPFDSEVLTLESVSGNAPLVVTFGPAGPGSNIFVQQGTFFINGAAVGRYYYFPFSRMTVLSASANIFGGNFTITGQVSNDLPGPAGNFFGPVILRGYGAIDGAYVATS